MVLFWQIILFHKNFTIKSFALVHSFKIISLLLILAQNKSTNKRSYRSNKQNCFLIILLSEDNTILVDFHWLTTAALVKRVTFLCWSYMIREPSLQPSKSLSSAGFLPWHSTLPFKGIVTTELVWIWKKSKATTQTYIHVYRKSTNCCYLEQENFFY